ncbi:MAG: hypothetical protein MSA89_07570 [Clostridium sp.]|nr:hypothetical protein [Clostridium sp.]MCI7442931.1 hypothetical protein [Clostridium sp.]
MDSLEEEKIKDEFNKVIAKSLEVSRDKQESILENDMNKFSEGAKLAFRVIVLGENYDDIVSKLAEDFKFSVICDLNEYKSYYQRENYEKVLAKETEEVKKDSLKENKVKEKKKKSEKTIDSKELLEIVNSLIKLNQEKKNIESLIIELEIKLKDKLKENEILNLDIGVLKKENNKITIEMEL